jgi:hypothetical protein
VFDPKLIDVGAQARVTVGEAGLITSLVLLLDPVKLTSPL